MPRKRKSSLYEQTKGAKRKKDARSNESEEQHENRLLCLSERRRDMNNTELETDRENRSQETVDCVQVLRNSVTRQQRLNQMEQERRSFNFDMLNAAFNYDPTLDYGSHPKITIGQMNVICSHCNAQKFPNEAPGMCCCNGKVSLPLLRDPPEPLLSLTSGMTVESKLFIHDIRKYNFCFQMTSFGASKVIKEAGYMPTFKIQGQVYHKAGLLLPAFLANIFYGK